MGTASLKAKLLYQLTATRADILYEVYLELWKSYEVFCRERCLDILVCYGIWPRVKRILWIYWGHLLMVA